MSSARTLFSTALTAALVTMAAAARADPASDSAPSSPYPLKYDLAIDGAVTAVGAVGWLTVMSLRETLGPLTCRWCSPNSFDLGVRSALVWSNHATAEFFVDFVGFGVGPVLIAGAGALAAYHDGGRLRVMLEDTLLVSEAVAVASDVNLALKIAIARQRPWAWAASQSPSTAALASSTRDANMSFYSGHATMMFSIATAAGTVAQMRGYRWARLVWIVGMPLALATCYLRIASDDHWMSDVLVGIGAGAATGFAVPYFAHRRVRLVPAGRTLSLVGNF